MLRIIYRVEDDTRVAAGIPGARVTHSVKTFDIESPEIELWLAGHRATGNYGVPSVVGIEVIDLHYNYTDKELQEVKDRAAAWASISAFDPAEPKGAKSIP